MFVELSEALHADGEAGEDDFLGFGEREVGEVLGEDVGDIGSVFGSSGLEDLEGLGPEAAEWDIDNAE